MSSTPSCPACLTQRWKVYEPPLVSFPRFDMVRKPPLSFLDFDSEETDLVMAAGDLGGLEALFVSSL
jgi:hypothetical protein